MIDSASTIDRPAAQLFTLVMAGSVVALAAMGYILASQPLVIAAGAGCLLMVGWAAFAFQRPRAAMAASFGAVLVAGTKFRTRDVTDSLTGILDAQIALELGLYGAIAVGVLAVCASRRYEERRLSSAEMLVVGYAGLALVSTSWSLAPALTFVRAMQLTIIAALAIVAVRVMSPGRALWTTCRALAIYALVCACSRVAFAATEAGAIDPDERFRFSWFAVHPITAGTLAGMAALGLLCAVLFSSRLRANRIVGLPVPLFAAVLIGVLIAASARGPLLAFAAAAGTIIMMRMRWPAHLGVVSAAAAALFLYLASGADYRDWIAAAARHESPAVQLFFRGQSADRVMGLNGRLELWDDLAPAVAANTALGHGYQASRAVVLDSAPWAAYAHNALLQVVLDLGIVGTVALIVLLGMGFVSAVRSNLAPWMRATVLALLIFLVVNSLGAESFAGSPGFETLLLVMSVLCATTSRPAHRATRATETPAP